MFKILSCHILIIFLVVTGIYISNNRTILTGDDTTPARYLPVSILTEFDLDLDEFPFLYSNGVPYFLKKVKNHYFSQYPIVSAVLAIPVYLTAKLGGLTLDIETLLRLEKLSATLIVAISVIFLFLALREFTSAGNTFLLTFLYAFATCSWAVSSQALWQHGSSQLFNSITIYFLIKGTKDKRYIGYAGFFTGMSIFSRPTNMLAAVIISAYIFHRHRTQLLKFLLWQSIPLIILIYHNYSVFHNIFGGYSSQSNLSNWNSPFFKTLAGLLFSPSRGLFIYTPVLIFSFIGIFYVLKQRKDILLIYTSLIPVSLIILLSNFVTWYGGGCFGPRFFNDVLPFFVVMMIPVLPLIKKFLFGKIIFIAFLVYSVGVQILGAYLDNNMWNAIPNINYNTERLWSWKDSQLIHIIKRLEILSKFTIRDRDYYSVDKKIDFYNMESHKYFGYGWNVPENFGTWATGKKSTLFVHFLDKSKAQKKIIVKCSSFESQKMKVYINGNPLGQASFNKPLWEWEIFEFNIPAEYLNGNIEKVKFTYALNRIASDIDLRRISVIFESIAFL